MLIHDRVVNALGKVLGKRNVGLHEPLFKGNEWTYSKECLDSTFVSSIGIFVNRFETELADYIGVKHAIAVVNGTAALHIALKLAGVLPGDEVLVPALTFVATPNAVSYCGAIPHFVDSEERTLGMAPVPLRSYLNEVVEMQEELCVNKFTGRVIRAMVPMHCFGHPADVNGLDLIASDFNIRLIEDAAESLGSSYKGMKTGGFGLFGCMSFNGNKIITTGGGGALLTNDTELAIKAKHITTTAKAPHKWEFFHDISGYNYRMPNINAAIGCAQLEQISYFLTSKNMLFDAYSDVFEEVEGVKIMAAPPDCKSNYWLQTLILDEVFAAQRDLILEATNSAGYSTRPAWQLMNHLPMYLSCPTSPLPVAESLVRRIINLPSSAGLV
jgi:aminotransferase in exopolysaccharide biosynthesis